MENTQTNEKNQSQTYNLSVTMDANKWAMLCHASAFAGLLIPFGNIIAPLIIWQLKRNEIKAVDVHGKESLNFQLSVTAAAIAIGILSTILIIIIIGPVIGMLAMLGLLAATVYYVIMASIAASKGENFKYPYSYPFVK
ncbi:MAG: DUF4870 domain-containing protein [Niabella sp.]|nr:MAG: DUF4870 domain-containing protein [Niabella sp.]